MNNFYKTNREISYSDVDNKGYQRVDSILSDLQTLTAIHSKEMGVDGDTTVQKSNAFWVLSRIKLKIFQMPRHYDVVEMETFPTTVSAVKFMRDYKITKDGKDMVHATSEWCTLDIETKGIRRTSSICYPFELEHRQDRSSTGDFLKIRQDVSLEDYHHTHVSRFVDIDSNGHTNNVAYMRMALNCFDLQEFSAEKINEVEIAYISQTYFGDQIKLYKTKTDYGYYVEGKKDDKTVFTCVFTK